jgi:hypothetical protein
VFGEEVAVVGPGVLEVDHEHRAVAEVIGGGQHRGEPCGLLDVDPYLLQHPVERVKCNLGLNQIGPIQVVQTVGPNHSILHSRDSLTVEIFLIVPKKPSNALQFLCDQIVASFKFLTLGSTMYIKIFISYVFVFCFFDEFFEVVGELVLAFAIEAEQVDAEDAVVVRN